MYVNLKYIWTPQYWVHTTMSVRHSQPLLLIFLLAVQRCKILGLPWWSKLNHYRSTKAALFHTQNFQLGELSSYVKIEGHESNGSDHCYPQITWKKPKKKKRKQRKWDKICVTTELHLLPPNQLVIKKTDLSSINWKYTLWSDGTKSMLILMTVALSAITFLTFAL